MNKIHRFVPVLVFFVAGTVFADVSQFVISSAAQTVAPNTLSAQITLQAQDASGNQQNVSETNDLVFTSTSQTGQFLNGSGNPVSTTMSNGTANKNFFYKDPTAGTYTITITATGRTSHTTLTASQSITIGDIPAESNSTSTSSTATTDNSQSSSLLNSVSAHTSPVDVSTANLTTDFEISAGRDRYTSTDNNVPFIASITKTGNVLASNVQYDWSFGDGSEAKGKSVSHRYLFPGEYNVVLNASYSDSLAVSRTQVTVIDPALTLLRVPHGIEIENDSEGEINVGEWSLVSGAEHFDLPQDTIIPSGKGIIVPEHITHIAGTNISLNDPMQKEVAVINTESSTTTTFALVDRATSTMITTSKPVAIQNTPPKKEIAKVPEPREFAPPLSPVDQATTTSTEVATVYVAESQNTFDGIFDLPRRSLSWVKGLFGKH